MTLTDNRVLDWSTAPVVAHDHAPIADFLATTKGLAGRKFAADSRDIAEVLSSSYSGAAVVVRDESGLVRGYAALHEPHGLEPELLGDFVFSPDTPPHVIDNIVDDSIRRFRIEAAAIPGAFLRVIIGTDQQAAIEALQKRGGRTEAEFIRTRKPLHDEDVEALAAAASPGIEILSWSEVVDRGLSEDVRRLQFDTFQEHFGNMSKTPEVWESHLKSRSFAPDFSIAAYDVEQGVIGYVLGSVFTAGVGDSEERSAHTDYIGVRGDQRKRGLGELLLRKIWLAALRRGVNVASLGTDINNKSNAHLLYRRLGYVAVEEQYSFRIDHQDTTE
ncbi:GNAT family N-acetyltransferase [Mycolicibacterium confluentis]|uniref:GNAT family acetyltransferase n=1 Tax=Mycolicibacterium confluentis TaxID=28047 RepID=A0A7I7XUI0_9MYCO|nr:GNAT family N-acetyltransferase [Mycolicibacterium confluentis]MCV7320769.1 GNAT family N-acetyltransferase [Mycolicibacterium confluentis]ORV27174.1 GNAT family acetyltransferase [Mycolicibacterium confluentis]BBZ32831.1 GNAT family acetyltransferase [Mycolicibacterium confluentis]